MNPSRLADIQIALQDFLLDKNRDLHNLTLETPQFSRQERLHIYHEAYRLRLIDALRKDYPALEMLVGEDGFIDICNEFISKHPSQHPSLRWLGEKLPGFLRSHAALTNQIQIAELAAFEWAQTMAFDAAEEQAASIDELRLLQPEQWMSLQLNFQPSLQLLNFYSNAPALWNNFIKENTAIEIEIHSEPQSWLVWREELQVVYRPLVIPEAWALGAFLQKSNFADVCGGLCEWFAEEEVPMKAAQYLQQWILGGLITNILTPV